MLNCTIIASPDQKAEIIARGAEEKPWWIVNDLETKYWYQRQLLKLNQGDIIFSDSVIRASELWHRMLVQIDPGWTLLPPQLSRYIVEKWMRSILDKNSWSLSSKDCQKTMATMAQILPLLSHFQSENVMEEWFEEQPEAKERWHAWYQISQSLWENFVAEKIIPGDWLKAIMIHQDLPQWGETPFVFDLGLDIDDIESELILNLSRIHDVNVLVPLTEVDKDYYRSLLDRCDPVTVPWEVQGCKKSFRKYPSMLSEVKEAVARVRQWADQGINLNEIAITSPQIETYWPTLSEHLFIEGIPCSKDISTPLSQIPFYQVWLAQIRTSLNRMKRGDGEIILFSSSDEPAYDFRRFKVLFENIYEPEDFHREEWVQNNIPKLSDPDFESTLSEFLEWSSQWVPKGQLSSFEDIIHSLDEVFLLNEKLKMTQWLDFFENYFSTNEKKLVPGSIDGLRVVSLSGVQNVPLKKVITLGMAESLVQEKQSTALLWKDVESIKLNFGFSLPHTDRLEVIDKLNWVACKSVDEIHYLYSETDFGGRYQAPSVFWLKEAIQRGHDLELESPGITRWDEILIDGLEDPEKNDPEREIHFQRDLGLTPFPSFRVPNLSLSASSFEEYHRCPFKLFARKGFGLNSEPSLDLDLDRLSSGKLLHKVCEIILKEKKTNLSEDEIELLVERARNEEGTPIYSDTMWNFIKTQYLATTKSFLESERLWKEKYPNTEPIGFEHKIKCHIDEKEGELEFGDQGFLVQGNIDRIDRNDQGQIAIIDYKSSGFELTHAPSWVGKGRFQLLLYCFVLMEGKSGDDLKNVVGAYYYNLREMDRSKGFSLQEASEDFLPSSRSTLKPEKKEEIFDHAKAELALMIQKIKRGEMGPTPRESKLCDNCDWNQICRNPDLNQ